MAGNCNSVRCLPTSALSRAEVTGDFGGSLMRQSLTSREALFFVGFTQTITEKEMANSGALERVPTRQGSEIPGRVINLDQARARHGDMADYMVRMLSVGDPLADVVIVEMDALGKEGRRI